jgi:tetratricopeptide (TPR) repeat protein
VQLADAVSCVLTLLRSGDMASAVASCADLVERAPREPAVHQLAATIALQRGDIVEAKRWADSALALRPLHAATLVLAGRVARAAGDRPQALAFFQHAMKAEPARAEAAFLSCICLLELGDAQAQDLLAFCLKSFPADARGWTAVGVALQDLKRPTAALAALTRAARIAPTLELHLRCGAVLTALGGAAQAIAAFRAACAIDPRDFDARLQLGLALRQSGDLAGARAALERAVMLDSKAAKGHFALGLVAQDMRDWPAAAAAYRAALKAQLDLAEPAVNLGTALQESGDLAPAKRAFRQALALRADAFGRIAQALTMAPHGELWLDQRALRQSLSD